MAKYDYLAMARGAVVRWTPEQIAEHERAMDAERIRQGMAAEDPALELDKGNIDAELAKRNVSVPSRDTYIADLMNVVKAQGKVAGVIAFRRLYPGSGLKHSKDTIEKLMERTGTVAGVNGPIAPI